MGSCAENAESDLYRRCRSVRKVAAELGCSVREARARLLAAGVELDSPGGRCALKPEAEVSAVDLYCSGERLSLAAVGARFGVSGDTVRRAVLRAGREVRSRSGVASAGVAADEGRVLELQDAGHPANSIAGLLGLNPSDVRRVLASAGRTPHRGKPLPPLSDLARAYAQTGSLRGVARRFHRSEPRIAAALRAAGVELETLRNLTPAEAAAAVTAAAGPNSAIPANNRISGPQRAELRSAAA